MHFLVTGYDGTDDGAPARRAAARPDHLASATQMMTAGQLPYAAALLSEGPEPKMIGSLMFVNFSTRDELDRWLKVEPYVVQKVWERIEIRPVQPGPIFMRLSEPQTAP